MESNPRSTDRGTTPQDIFAAKWQQMRGTLRSWWGKISDDDWERIAGQKDRLIGMLQEKYGYARDMALREVERRFQEYSGQGKKSDSQSDTATHHRHGTGTSQQDVSQSADLGYGEKGAQASETGARTDNRIDDVTRTVGERMNSWAGTLRERVPQQGAMGSAAHTVANQLETTASYLQNTNVTNMKQDVTGLIRRYPLRSVLVGFGLGYLFSRRSGR